MLDINKSIHDPDLSSHDPEGHMYDLEPWSRAIAQNLANREGLGELTEMHWVVIHRLRGEYRANGRASSPRQLLHAIEQDFADQGGLRYLYQLFPKGPATQGSRLAGLPEPSNSHDLSFGWFG